jgi:hypothetical protein
MTESMDRPDEPELVDPGSKTQPAEGGRDEVEASPDAEASPDPSRDRVDDA